MFFLKEASNSKDRKKEPNLPPGTFGLLSLRFLPLLKRDTIGFFKKLNRKFGKTVRFGIFKISVHIITQPDDVRKVLQENSQNYHKGIFYIELGRILGKGILLSEGEFWKKQRKLIQPSFHRQRISEFVQVMANETDKMLNRWKNLKQTDVSREMMHLTFSIVGKTLFKTEVESYANRIESAVTIALGEVSKRAKRIFPAPFHWNTPGNVRIKQSIAEMNSVVYDLIEQRKKSPSNDIITMLLEARDEETGETMSEQQIRDEAITLLIAGHETTANALSWAFYLLSQNPEAFEKVRAEAFSVLGDREPNMDDIQKLSYTRKVVDETLRLYPPAWIIERRALGWDELGGYDVPPSTNVSICIFNLHRNPDFWNNPDQFDPDRFDEENSKDRPKYAYIPFGGGPRVCIGNVFALTEAVLVLAMVARKFRFSLVPGKKIALEPLVTLRPKYGVHLNLVST
ncbi:cytochrome P450 [Leptospira perolatii]|uniref:Cytochrome P450 n=1 Tax=Leptospira perolatii TaxID=2023191 RepID=A0A2M9ZKP0_9LEPT|nr:cytochrome P450 [Leptospira perolatii]PJZ69950.1 cytochrome P450 [Leptospira perolatii]PJZ72642.1 cytochrome P450 [Leptospira perolatii]